jgi:hypothetical protein
MARAKAYLSLCRVEILEAQMTMYNAWGNNPLLVDAEEFCPNCERETAPISGMYRHYDNCDPTARKTILEYINTISEKEIDNGANG